MPTELKESTEQIEDEEENVENDYDAEPPTVKNPPHFIQYKVGDKVLCALSPSYPKCYSETEGTIDRIIGYDSPNFGYLYMVKFGAYIFSRFSSEIKPKE